MEVVGVPLSHPQPCAHQIAAGVDGQKEGTWVSLLRS